MVRVAGRVESQREKRLPTMLPTSASRWAASVMMARLWAKYPPARAKRAGLVLQVCAQAQKRERGQTPKCELGFFTGDGETESFHFLFTRPHFLVFLHRCILTTRKRAFKRAVITEARRGPCPEFPLLLSFPLSRFWSPGHPTPTSQPPPPTHLLRTPTQGHPWDSGWRAAQAGVGRLGLQEQLSDLPTTSPAMKTQHTAQAAHSCLCACSLSGVRPGCGRGSLWQWWKGISTGLGSSGRVSEGSAKRLRQATWFSRGLARRLTCSSLSDPRSCGRASSDVAQPSLLPKAWSQLGPCAQRATREMGPK